MAGSGKPGLSIRHMLLHWAPMRARTSLMLAPSGRGCAMPRTPIDGCLDPKGRHTTRLRVGSGFPPNRTSNADDIPDAASSPAHGHRPLLTRISMCASLSESACDVGYFNTTYKSRAVAQVGGQLKCTTAPIQLNN
ncbi:hypothetical protein GQ53DRAFT_24125 [Thozetella sp. PMI_491]|nr:hypothetical protein GQ53DRAFT_24125 [Thozetella sp. PMI_491]